MLTPIQKKVLKLIGGVVVSTLAGIGIEAISRLQLRFDAEGYDRNGYIIYKLIRITPSRVMTMRIQCPPYGNDNDKQQKRYVQECIYRCCSFANDGHSAPRTYTKYLQDQE